MHSSYILIFVFCLAGIQGKAYDRDKRSLFMGHKFPTHLNAPVNVADNIIDYVETPGLSVTIDESTPGHWNFHEQEKWGDLFPACGGSQQSPINIDTNLVLNVTKTKCLKWRNYESNQRFLTLKNNGHTIEASCTWESNLIPQVEGGILSGKYNLAAMHWHWGSDDSKGSDDQINHIESPLELHFVHYNAKFPSLSAALASGESEALVVVAILFQRDTIPNPGMFLLVNAMQLATTSGVQHSVLPLGDLGLNFKDDYFTYSGSLTTPPCYQVVRWIIARERISITERQLEVFRNVLVNDEPLVDNYRGVQPLNGRQVSYISKCKN